MLPGPLRRKLIALHTRLQPSQRWVRNEYAVHNRAVRRELFLNIARFAHINRPITGYYFEFGCHGAESMRLAWDHFRHLFDWDYVGFDSFQGLPKIGDIDKQEIWQEGRLKTTEAEFRALCERHGMPRERLTTVAGFFADSLNEDCRRRFAHRKAAVIYVDCDLYESTVPVLEFCRDFLQVGTVIVFDDWCAFYGDPRRGERRAFAEFCARHPGLEFEPFVGNGIQQSFVCVGGV
jgi:hypothetical protein